MSTTMIATSTSTKENQFDRLIAELENRKAAVKTTATKLSMAIARRAKEARRKADLSRRAAAEVLGVRPHIVTLMERPTAFPGDGSRACAKRLRLLNKIEAFAQKSVELKKSFAPAA